MDGSMGRNAIQPEDLIKPEAQQILQGGFLRAAAGFAGDQPVEGGQPADHAVNRSPGRAPGRRGKGGSGQGVFEQIFGKFISRFTLPQNAGCNLSWIFVVQIV